MSAAPDDRNGDRRWALAWLLLTLALAGHVIDEALTDFLSVYNPAVEAIAQQLPWLTLPVLTFESWISGLAIAVLNVAQVAFAQRFVLAVADVVRFDDLTGDDLLMNTS